MIGCPVPARLESFRLIVDAGEVDGIRRECSRRLSIALERAEKDGGDKMIRKIVSLISIPSWIVVGPWRLEEDAVASALKDRMYLLIASDPVICRVHPSHYCAIGR